MLGGLGYGEMMLFGIIALILFGSRLPEVARNLGGSYRELRKHLNDFQREFQAVEHYEPPKRPSYEKEDTESESGKANIAAPRFIPPPPPEDLPSGPPPVVLDADRQDGRSAAV